MVAYSFKRFFVPQIVVGLKRQTVRADRRRHARPGEAVQLYEGMRTRHCRKIVDPDPVCTETLPIVIETSLLLDCIIAAIEIDGVRLNRDEIEAFARADGFAPEHMNNHPHYFDGTTARENMGAFWFVNHPEGRADQMGAGPMTKPTDISALVATGDAASRKLEDVKLAVDEAAADLAILVGPERAAWHFAQISIELAKLADSEAGI